jgi:hypothetical protein
LLARGRFSSLCVQATIFHGCVVLPFVISTGAVMDLRPTQGDEERFGPATIFHGTVALSFVIPSAAEGSAVPRTFPGNAESHPPQNCHLDRTRISCHAALDMAACAAFVKESRMKCANAIKFHRKSGGA